MTVGVFVFAIFAIPAAVAKNAATVFVCRFIAGVFGAAPLAIVSKIPSSAVKLGPTR